MSPNNTNLLHFQALHNTQNFASRENIKSLIQMKASARISTKNTEKGDIATHHALDKNLSQAASTNIKTRPATANRTMTKNRLYKNLNFSNSRL